MPKSARAATPSRIARASARVLGPASGSAPRCLGLARQSLSSDARFSVRLHPAGEPHAWPNDRHRPPPNPPGAISSSSPPAPRRPSAAAALVWPFVASMAPDAETVAAGAPVELDLAPIADGPDRQGVLARQADLRPPPHAGGDQGGRGRRTRDPARPAARLGARQGGPRPLARRLRQLHPSRLRAARPAGRVQGLVLPLPRLGLRHLRPRPRRPGADQPADPALHLRCPTRKILIGAGATA